MSIEKLQRQSNLINRYFKTTTEPYDELEWDGKTLQVWLGDETIETYTHTDLTDIIHNF